MNEKTVKVLEYEKVTRLLLELAGAEMTRVRITELRPFVDIREVRDGLDETTEAVKLITYKGPLPLGNFYDISGYVNLASKGGCLSMGDLLKVYYNLSITQKTVSFLKGDVPQVPTIISMGSMLEVYKSLEEDIDRCILSEDEMFDSASPQLKSIRRDVLRHKEALRNRLQQIVNSSKNRTILQDAIITMRDGRYVVPVKAEHKHQVPGIVHDQSASGATLFVEPQAIVNLNNQLRQLEVEEQAEISRILMELSSMVAEHRHGLMNNLEILGKLDFIMAKGKLSAMQRGERPRISENGEMQLISARHPLIDTEKVVPINVGIGGKTGGLMITGPNTGGKTVTLKTCGLLAMMAQTGLHIPADGRSKIPIYRDIFADIGDEQSIEQSLSTFSSHMRGIVEIVEKAGKDTLILLDELGAGTDPTEGAALAIAILEELMSKKACVLATTHYTELKKYALEKEGVENASMEFDLGTLSPTYKLIMGMPGKSNAFEISRKLGLEENIINKARNLLEGGDLEFEQVLSAIESDRKAAEAERDEAIMLKLEVRKQREAIEKAQASLERKEQDILNKAKEKARVIIEEAKELTREVSQELKDLAKEESLGQRNKLFDQSRKRVKDAAGRYRETFIKEVNDNPVDIKSVKPGQRVKILSLRQNGEVMTLPDDKGEMTVQAGILKVRVHADDLMVIHDGGRKEKKPVKTSYSNLYKSKAQSIRTSVDVRGLTLDEATDKVRKYIDDALMAGLRSGTIIHGRGEGILKNGIRQELAKHKHLDSHRPGNYNEGGDGVTMVNLKK